MKLFKTLKFLYKAEHPHFLYVGMDMYERWKWLVKLVMLFNKEYIPCEIYKKKYKIHRNFVVVGLKWSGKNVKRRTSGYAKDFVLRNKNAKCLYCESKLTIENATSDHIVTISNGGNNTQVNLVVCCNECNNSRGDMNFNDFIYMKKPYLKGQKIIL
jgi:hypothetical protein